MLVTCEVCERELDREDAFAWEDDGEVYYFCSEECLEQAGEATPVDAGWAEEPESQA